MYSKLIHEHNLSSTTLKIIEFTDEQGYPLQPIEGFFAVKDRTKYWIDKDLISELPLKAGKDVQRLSYKEDIVLRPMNPAKFRILPEQKFNIRMMIDEFVSFEHTHPKDWQLLKFIALAGMVGRTYICVSSPSEFGKSSIFDVMHYLTDKCPVFKPRSIPGVLNHINSTGNLVFDETHECKKEVLNIIEEFALQIAGGKSIYINGALKSAKTRDRYNCCNQSITFLYNDVGNYKDPKKEYFEYIFSNNKAIDTRFLKVKLKGKLTEEFSKDFDIPQCARSNLVYYMNFLKTVEYLRELRTNNGYVRLRKHDTLLNIKGRRRMVYDEITWLMDMYSTSQEEYDELVSGLDTAITEYKVMVSELDDKVKCEEESV